MYSRILNPALFRFVVNTNHKIRSFTNAHGIAIPDMILYVKVDHNTSLFTDIVICHNIRNNIVQRQNTGMIVIGYVKTCDMTAMLKDEGKKL